MESRELPYVSVVVPVRNSELTVEGTVQSLLALEYPQERLELILVDNASTDGTAGILAAYSDRLRCFREPKRGVSAARNRGIFEARHPVVAFTDADCVVDRDWLRQLVVPLEDATVGISGGRILAARPCNPVQKYGEWLHDHERAIQEFEPPYVISMNWASRRGVLLETGGFDESLFQGEDVDLAYRVLQAGYRLAYRAGAVIRHHNRPDLKGLFREGFRDGFYSVIVLRKHQAFVARYGHRRVSIGGYKTLAANALRLLLNTADSDVVFDTVFNSGKKLGKLLGSIRVAHLEL
jgi:glycosyltransferase involved in cell wall biosynthesis